jgi:hypothetical protein
MECPFYGNHPDSPFPYLFIKGRLAGRKYTLPCKLREGDDD